MSSQVKGSIRRKQIKYWQSHIQAYQKSGLSQAEYCRQNNLRSNRLRYWKNKFKNQENPQNPCFVNLPVKISDTKPESKSESGVNVILSDGIVLSLSTNFDKATLTKAVDILGGR
jgi:hypothetical protein